MNHLAAFVLRLAVVAAAKEYGRRLRTDSPSLMVAWCAVGDLNRAADAYEATP